MRYVLIMVGILLAAGCRPHVPQTEEDANGGEPVTELRADEPEAQAAAEAPATEAAADETPAVPSTEPEADKSNAEEVAEAADKHTIRHAGMVWYTNLDAAVAKAQADNKQIFMNFTGSDWCGFCKLLTEQVLTDPVFQREIQTHFVLLYIDYPSDESLLTEAQHRHNALLARYYNVYAFPTLLLAWSSGKAYASVPYQPDSGSEAYLRQVMEAKEKYAD